MYLGVDTSGTFINGTFADSVPMHKGGTIAATKALTAPGELEKAVSDAIELAARDRGATVHSLPAQIKAFGHGASQATQALIEWTGARVGLVTTLSACRTRTPRSHRPRMWNAARIRSLQKGRGVAVAVQTHANKRG